jgi:hypothetical protein
MKKTLQINTKKSKKITVDKMTEDLILDRGRLHSSQLDDNYHNIKRNMGFSCFNRILKNCQRGKCPRKLSSKTFYALCDMSLEGYALQQAYHFWEERVGSSDEKRYFKALGNINIVLNCKNKAKIEKKLFSQDSRQVYFKIEKEETFYQSARLRKAYWAYLKESPNNDQIEDYFSTCEYIDKTHQIYNKRKCTLEDFEKYKKLLSENRHIANPLDLLRLCIIKEKLE